MAANVFNTSKLDDLKLDEAHKLFSFSIGLINLNHGSYGSLPKPIQEEQQRLQRLMESCPDEWFRRSSLHLWQECLDQLAIFINSQPENLVFVQNTTTGISTILKSFPFVDGDVILVANTSYNATVQAANATCQLKTGVNVCSIEIAFPIESTDHLLDKYRKFLTDHPKVKMVIIDHITSGTAVRMPVKELTAMMREFDVIVCVDGAHAAGQIKDLNIEEIGADFYTGTLHKWCLMPRASGFLWAAPKHHAALLPLATSHFHGDPRLRRRFFLVGTRDDTPYLCFPRVRRLWDQLGGFNEVYEHNKKLADEAASLLVKMWGTGELEVPESMKAPYMRMVRLPHVLGYEKTPEDATKLLHDIFLKHQIVVIILGVQGELYLRTTSQIFNRIHEYEKFGRIILEMTESNLRPKAYPLKEVEFPDCYLK